MNLKQRDDSRYMRQEKEKGVYLCTRNTDMRKSINGLAAIVQGHFEMDPFNGATFVFINRTHDKIKTLVWDVDGFVLHYKRREKGRFQWHSQIGNDTPMVEITRIDLERLLDGLVMEQFVPHRKFHLY